MDEQDDQDPHDRVLRGDHHVKVMRSEDDHTVRAVRQDHHMRVISGNEDHHIRIMRGEWGSSCSSHEG